jgi:hypothetical protein
MADVLLRPYPHSEGHQGGNSGQFIVCCQLHVCEGECFVVRKSALADSCTGALLSLSGLRKDWTMECNLSVRVVRVG